MSFPTFHPTVRCVRSKVQYFAKRLHNSMAGLGTNDKTLIRIVVSRSEIDLGDIKEAFQEMYGKSLESWIKVNIVCFFFLFPPLQIKLNLSPLNSEVNNPLKSHQPTQTLHTHFLRHGCWLLSGKTGSFVDPCQSWH